MNTSEIQQMSPSERLQSMEILWDAICHDSEEPPSPVWHGAVLADRKRLIESGEAAFLSLEDVRERLKG
jgi:hypothetical protein